MDNDIILTVPSAFCVWSCTSFSQKIYLYSWVSSAIESHIKTPFTILTFDLYKFPSRRLVQIL